MLKAVYDCMLPVQVEHMLPILKRGIGIHHSGDYASCLYVCAMQTTW